MPARCSTPSRAYTGLHEFDSDLRPEKIDAVVHFAAIPRIMITPDNEVYRINVMGTYNVLEAATKLGIPKVIIASSETTYGIVFANGHRDPEYFPLDEDYPVDPMDSYAMSKICQREDRPGLCAAAPAPTSMRSASATSSSRRNTSCSRAGSPSPISAGASPGATSMRATSARSYARHRDRRPRLPGLQRRQRPHLVRPADGGAAAALLPERAGKGRLGEFEGLLSNRKTARCSASAKPTTGANTSSPAHRRRAPDVPKPERRHHLVAENPSGCSHEDPSYRRDPR